MVDPDSDRISRVPPYSGTALRSLHHFAYGAFTLFGRLSQNLSAIMKISYSAPCRQTALQPHLYRWFRLLRFRSPLLPESFLFSFPGVLRWFSSPSLASVHYFIHIRMTESLLPGYPIRLSTDHRMFAPPRRFSQLATAFFASIRQGIRRKPLFRLTILSFLLHITHHKLLTSPYQRVLAPSFPHVKASRFLSKNTDQNPLWR